MAEELNIDLPPWAIGRYRGYMEPGVQLCTKDGRKIGNGVVVEAAWGGGLFHQWFCISVVTDIGNRLELGEKEVAELFYRPKWVMDMHTHNGYKVWQEDVRCGRD